VTSSWKTSLAAVLLTASLSGVAFAETAEPTYKGDPDVYKIVFENADVRIIEAIRKPGVRDKVHGHPVASVVYSVTDCTNRLVGGDGKSVDRVSKAGIAEPVPVIPAHTAENTGSADCKQIFIEKK
jgi:hypothetical protein